MQAGTIFRPLGRVGLTRWADWVDLVTPWLVLATAAGVLVAVAAPLRPWVVLAAGGLLFTEGHSLHLAANSIANVEPSDIAHLWDEVASHYLWYAGLAVVFAALALALAPGATSGRPAPPGPAVSLAVGAPGYVLGGLTGLTLFNTYVEGGTPVLGLLVGAAFLALGWRWRAHGAGRLLLVTFGVAVALLAGWGAYWRGFPQFSELGWI